jgi:hypothetical protein
MMEELYVAGTCVRTIFANNPEATACQELLTQILAAFPNENLDRIAMLGENFLAEGHGYTEHTITTYGKGRSIVGAVHGMDYLDKSPIFIRNPNVLMCAIKYKMKSGTREYKYLLEPEQLEDFQLPDKAVLVYYALVSNKEEGLVDQFDAYFTVPTFEDLSMYASELGLPCPIGRELFNPHDWIGTAFVTSTKRPIRLKYYRRNRSKKYTVKPDGSFAITAGKQKTPHP